MVQLLGEHSNLLLSQQQQVVQEACMITRSSFFLHILVVIMHTHVSPPAAQVCLTSPSHNRVESTVLQQLMDWSGAGVRTGQRPPRWGVLAGRRPASLMSPSLPAQPARHRLGQFTRAINHQYTCLSLFSSTPPFVLLSNPRRFSGIAA